MRTDTERLTMARIRAARASKGETVLLFLTDRCPVGCAHCSVDSRPDSPVISDRDRVRSLVDSLCQTAGPWLVGISGGEPFVEKWGLTHAVTHLRAAGKHVAIVTSGHWGAPNVPAWISDVLALAHTIILSSDTFHRRQLSDDKFVSAARAAAAAGCWVVVQTLDDPESIAGAEALAAAAFGDAAAQSCELACTTLLDAGRARGRDTTGADSTPVRLSTRRAGRELTGCAALGAPVIRYDGHVTPCCNEEVSTGAGPGSLHRRANTAHDLAAVLHEIAHDPLLGLIGTIGPGELTALPGLRDLGDLPCADICELCWAIHERVERDPALARAVERLSIVAGLHAATLAAEASHA